VTLGALLLPVLLAAAKPAPGENRYWLASLELSGPLEELHIDAGSAGRSVVSLDLLAGERIALEVPVPLRNPLGSQGLASLPDPQPRIVPASAGGSARFLAWTPPPSLPRSLLPRPRPPLAGIPLRPGAVELTLALAILVLALGLRRSPVRCALICGLGGLALALIGSRSRPGPGELVLVEGDLRQGVWMEVRAGLGVLEGEMDALELGPAGGPVELALERRSDRAPRLTARAAGARLHALLRLDAPGGELRADRNGWASLEEVWLRSPAGRWSALGAWTEDLPLPEAEAPGAGAAPGWLMAGLPQGVGILLGRFAGSEPPRWLRVSGFER
jgi:hypothetical protein